MSTPCLVHFSFDGKIQYSFYNRFDGGFEETGFNLYHALNHSQQLDNIKIRLSKAKYIPVVQVERMLEDFQRGMSNLQSVWNDNGVQFISNEFSLKKQFNKLYPTLSDDVLLLVEKLTESFSLIDTLQLKDASDYLINLIHYTNEDLDELLEYCRYYYVVDLDEGKFIGYHGNLHHEENEPYFTLSLTKGVTIPVKVPDSIASLIRETGVNPFGMKKEIASTALEYLLNSSNHDIESILRALVEGANELEYFMLK